MKIFLAVFIAIILTATASAESERENDFRKTVKALENVVDELVSPAVQVSVEPLEPSFEPLFRAEAVELLPSEEPFVETSVIPESPYELAIIDPIGAEPNSVVIILHGLNSSIEEVRPVVDTSRFALPTTRFILPQAPMKLVGFLGETVPAWFDVPSLDPTVPEAADEIREAAQNIADIAAIQQLELGISADKIALVGISQGGGVAATAYMRYKWAGGVIVSGFLPIMNTYPAEMTDDSADAPLLMLHGSEDEVVPALISRASADLMIGLGRPVEYQEFEDGHALTNSLPIVISRTIQKLMEILA